MKGSTNVKVEAKAEGGVMGVDTTTTSTALRRIRYR